MQWVTTPFNSQESGLNQVGPPGPQGPQGARGPQGPSGGGVPVSGMVSIFVREHIDQFSLVTVLGTQADSDNPSHVSLLAGIALDEAWPGMELVVAFYGVVENPAWTWLPNRKLWANGKWLSYSPPEQGWNQLVAVTLDATHVFIRLSQPVLL